MENNNNGKITVGILIMFVIAISIIGVTYAYFTAQFSPNLNPESVKITAGNLLANYKTGQNITVSNVVPGWVSDGLHYYDIDEAATHGGNIYAIKTTAEYLATKTPEEMLYYKKMGLASPLEFSVTNVSDSTQENINYIISMNVIQNGIYDAWTGISDENAINDPTGQGARKTNMDNDRKRLYVTLYRGKFDSSKSVTDNYGDKDGDGNPINQVIGGPYILGDTGTKQVMVKLPETIAVGQTNDYFAIFKYANDPNANQILQGRMLKVEANVIGIQKDNTAAVTYTSIIEGASPKITAAHMEVRDEGTNETAVALENTNKTTKLASFKSEHGSKTVWYNEDNEIVYFALASEEKSDGFDSDEVTVQ